MLPAPPTPPQPPTLMPPAAVPPPIVISAPATSWTAPPPPPPAPPPLAPPPKATGEAQRCGHGEAADARACEAVGRRVSAVTTGAAEAATTAASDVSSVASARAVRDGTAARRPRVSARSDRGVRRCARRIADDARGVVAARVDDALHDHLVAGHDRERVVAADLEVHRVVHGEVSHGEDAGVTCRGEAEADAADLLGRRGDGVGHAYSVDHAGVGVDEDRAADHEIGRAGGRQIRDLHRASRLGALRSAGCRWRRIRAGTAHPTWARTSGACSRLRSRARRCCLNPCLRHRCPAPPSLARRRHPSNPCRPVPGRRRRIHRPPRRGRRKGKSLGNGASVERMRSAKPGKSLEGRGVRVRGFTGPRRPRRPRRARCRRPRRGRTPQPPHSGTLEPLGRLWIHRRIFSRSSNVSGRSSYPPGFSAGNGISRPRT